MNWIRNENVAWEELDGGALLVDAGNGHRWQLSAAALGVWKLCDGSRSLKDIAKTLRHSRASVEQFCHQYEQSGLLLRTAGSTGSMIVFKSSNRGPFSARPMGLGSGPRRRPSPRGNSGPG